MRCGSNSVETGTTIREREGDVKAGARAGLSRTFVDVATRRVGEVVSGTGETVGVMAVVKNARGWSGNGVCHRLLWQRGQHGPD